jgi:autotransporter adhesin
VGWLSWATEEGATAFGSNAWATGSDSSAFGEAAWASGSGATSIGYNSWAPGNSSTALGRGAFAYEDYSIAVGYQALGNQINTIAIGTNSLANDESAIAIGAGSESTGNNSVALGAGSFADRDYSVSVGSAGNERQITNVAAGTEDTDAVNKAQLDEVAGSVGELADTAVQYDDDSKGTITLAGEEGTVISNVAAGELSADSTDAVNGSQLFETNERVGVVEGRVDDLDGRVGDMEDGVANAVQYDDDSKASATLAGEDGTVIGNLAAGSVSATSTEAINGSQLYGALDSTAAMLGGGAAVTAFGVISAPTYLIQGSNYFNVGDALGALDASISQLDQRLTVVESNGGGTPTTTTDNRVKVDGGDEAQVGDGTKGVAIGSDANANGSNGVAVGGGAFAAGPNDTAIGGNASVGADGSTAVGANSTISSTSTNAVAIGEGASVDAASGTAIGQGASVTGTNSVALGQGSVADRDNTVSVGSVGNERQVTNVADGTAATDAVNKGQLDTGIAEAKTYTDTTATKTLTSANAYTDAKFAAWDDTFTAFQGEIDHRFREQDRRIDRQGAMGAAMLNMATSAAGIRTQNRVGVGVGFQNGESALSVGYQRAISDRAVITVGGAFSGDETSVGLGAGFGW